MNNALKNLMVAVALVGFAVPAAAKQEKGSGDAAREQKETGAASEEHATNPDNRGRTARTARRIHHSTHATHVANNGAPVRQGAMASKRSTKGAGASVKTVSAQRTPSLKTGQLTTSQSSHVAARPTSMHQASHSNLHDTAGKSAAKKGSPEDPNSPPIRLPKHNARMF